MAKVIAPLLSLAAKGALAKSLVFLNTRGQPYARTYAVPTGNATVPQIAARSVFTFGNRLYRTMSGRLRAPWEANAAGEVKSPHNVYVGRFVQDNLGKLNLDNLTGSPGNGGAPRLETYTVTPLSLRLRANATAGPTPTGWILENVIFGILRDQDPENGTLFDFEDAQDGAFPYARTFAGLIAGVVYQVFGLPTYTKPDGSTAYGPSSVAAGTPTP